MTTYTTKEVCELLKLSKVSVLRLLNSGRLKGTRVSVSGVGRGTWRITEEALREYMESTIDRPEHV